MWSRRFGPILLVVAVLLAWGLWRALDYLQLRGELLLARQDLSRGRFDQARIRLAALTAARPGALGGQLDYWLGVCESSSGRVDAALAAFARVPSGFVFDPQAAHLEAEANIQR